MKIGFIAEPYEEKNISGMGYAVLQTGRFLLIEGAQHEYVFFSSQSISKEFIPGNYRVVRVPKSLLGKFFWFLCMREKLDVIIFMLPLLPLWVPRTKAVPIFHELGSQKTPVRGLRDRIIALVRDRILMPLSLAKAARIISISKATTDDIVTFYGVDRSRIDLCYVGYQDWKEYANEAPPVDPSMKPYFFFAGKVKPRKNVHGLVDAFIAFKRRTRSDVKLVIAGGCSGDYYHGLVKKLEGAGHAGDVYFLGYVENPQMYALFSNALACVFPSLNEGFGMPIVEAMSFGTPVITSNISSMVEVAGGAALLVNPHDVESIADALGRIASDEALRNELIAKGIKRASEFSWPKAVHKYLAVFESARNTPGVAG